MTIQWVAFHATVSTRVISTMKLAKSALISTSASTQQAVQVTQFVRILTCLIHALVMMAFMENVPEAAANR